MTGIGIFEFVMHIKTQNTGHGNARRVVIYLYIDGHDIPPHCFNLNEAKYIFNYGYGTMRL